MNVRKVIKILTASVIQAQRKQHVRLVHFMRKVFFFSFLQNLLVLRLEEMEQCVSHPAISELTVLLQQAAKWKGMQ